MQIVENWSDIEGELEGHRRSDGVEGFVTLRVRIDKVAPVEGFSNLLKDPQGKTIEINVPESLLENVELGKGNKVRARVRKAGKNNLFVHQEHFSITP